jgi:hypothetical protein
MFWYSQTLISLFGAIHSPSRPLTGCAPGSALKLKMAPGGSLGAPVTMSAVTVFAVAVAVRSAASL